MALDDHYDASRLAGKITRVPKLPVAGFWVRLIAFIVDFIILTFFFYVLAMMAREPLLAMGPWSANLATLVIFVYFWLGDGPVGKGRTVGKALMGLRTVNATDGQPLSPGNAAARAFVLLPPKLYFDLVVVHLSNIYPQSVSATFIFYGLAFDASIALYLAQIVHVAFNPARQGFHDRVADTLVLGMDHPDTVWSAIQEQAGPQGLERIRKSHNAGFFCFVVVLLILVFTQIGSLRQGFSKTQDRNKILNHYHVSMNWAQVRIPIEGKENGKEGAATAKGTKAVHPAKKPQTSPADKGTTPTSYGPPKEFKVYLLHTGKVSSPLAKIRKDTDYLADYLMKDYFRGLVKEEEQRIKDEYAKKGSKPPEGELPLVPKGSRFTFVYQEYLDLVLYQKGYDVLQVERTF